MGKQTKSKATQPLGKGKVTPMQIAFIVDRYLSDNNFSDTRSVFRTEAASLISKSPVQEAPKSLLSLGAMLNEYICLKEQKVMVDQERVRLEQEKFRVQKLLQGMQDVMNAYNVGGTGNTPTPPLVYNSASGSMAVVPQSGPASAGCGSPNGCPVYTSSPSVMPVSMPSSVIGQQYNASSSVANLTRKRVGSIVGLEPPSTTKKYRNKLPSKKQPNQAITQEAARPDNGGATDKTAQSSMIRSSPHNHIRSSPLIQGSSVAKSLFNQPWLSSPTNTTGPNTPPQAVASQNGQSVSLAGVSSAACCNDNVASLETPTNCTVITSERVIVSPCKHVAYTMERNQCISSSSPVKITSKRVTKRENVKGRLDFDGSDVVATTSLDNPIVEDFCTSESDKEGNIFDIDLPNFDAFGANFSFSELLVDLDLDCEGIGCPCPSILDASTETNTGSSPESMDGNQGTDPLTSEFSSNVTEVISGKDINMVQGADTLTAVTSITKCIILSPAKTKRNSLEQ